MSSAELPDVRQGTRERADFIDYCGVRSSPVGERFFRVRWHEIEVPSGHPGVDCFVDCLAQLFTEIEGIRRADPGPFDLAFDEPAERVMQAINPDRRSFELNVEFGTSEPVEHGAVEKEPVENEVPVPGTIKTGAAEPPRELVDHKLDEAIAGFF